MPTVLVQSGMNAKTFGEASTSEVLMNCWQPNPVSVEVLSKLAKEHPNTSVLEEMSFRITESPLINKAIKHIALKKAIKKAKVELEKRVALKVKRIVNTLGAEAGIKDKKVLREIYKKLITKLYKEIKELKPFYEVYYLNKVYVFFKFNPSPDIPTRAANLFARLIENGKI